MKRYLFAAGLSALVASLMFGGIAAGSKLMRPYHPPSMLKQAALGKIQAPAIPIRVREHGHTVRVERKLPFFSAGTLAAMYGRITNEELHEEGADAPPKHQIQGHGGGHGTLGCSRRDSRGNARVNQDCSYRRQAEEDITYDPTHPNTLVGGQNDSRVGFNQCGIDWSTDNGSHWGDMLPPFRQRLNAPELMGPNSSNPNNNTILGDPGTFHTYDVGSDPANAVDAFGNAYFSCVVFDVASFAAGVYVTQSPAGADGSFYYNVPSPPSKLFMAVEDNSSLIVHDKNMISADRYRRSPNAGNVYLTWTVFRFGTQCGHPPNGDENFCSSPIFGSMSTDGAKTWSTPEEISGSAPGLCFFGDFFDPGRNPSDCDFDQGSYSVALPNGDLQVIFNNGNTAAGNPNAQQLGVHCHPSGSSTAGTAHFNCMTPTKVGDDVVIGEPQCDFGRGPEECIPGAYIRTNDFPRITKDNTQNNHVYAVWQDYRNGEFDIQLSRSTDGGVTWHEAGTVNPDDGLDHYMPATDQSPQNGDKNGASYYRTQRVPGEDDPNVGCLFGISPPDCTPFTPGVQPGVGEEMSDYVVAGGRGGNTPYAFRVVSPQFPPPDGIQTGFNGDYSGLTVNRGDLAHPIWSDTRNVNPFPLNGVTHDEDVFTDKVGLPNGRGHHGHGTIGRARVTKAKRHARR